MPASFNDFFLGGIEFSTGEFESEIDSVVVPTFKVAYERLDEWQKATNRELRERLRIAGKDEEERDMAHSEVGWENQMLRSRNRALGAGALNWICSAMHSELMRLEAYLTKSEIKSEYGWLWKAKKKFKDEFDIDFEKATLPFELIKEIVLARNALVHFDDPKTFEKYRDEISSPRFMAEFDEEMYVSWANFLAAAEESKGFIRWVFGEAKKLNLEGGAKQ